MTKRKFLVVDSHGKRLRGPIFNISGHNEFNPDLHSRDLPRLSSLRTPGVLGPAGLAQVLGPDNRSGILRPHVHLDGGKLAHGPGFLQVVLTHFSILGWGPVWAICEKYHSKIRDLMRHQNRSEAF